MLGLCGLPSRRGSREGLGATPTRPDTPLPDLHFTVEGSLDSKSVGKSQQN